MNMPLVLLNRRRRGGAAAFTPAGLFALAEPGVWYDPSDLTTLFQDTAGATPVTTPGQTVALALDKSKGLVLGGELVTNGDFSNGTTGWSVTANSTAAVISGEVEVTISGSSNGLQQTITGLTAGNYYQVKGRLRRGVNATEADLRIATTAGALVANFRVTSTSNTEVSGFFVATATSHLVRLQFSASTYPATIFADNISVKELPGFHATQATLASRPTYGIVPLGGRRNLLLNTDTLATQNVTVTAVSHVLSFTGTGTITLTGASTAGPLIGTGAGNRVSLTFTPTAGSLTITVVGSVTLAQLELGSTVTNYQRVGTSAFDVTEAGVASLSYLSFDGVDDFMVTPTITPGIDRAQVFAGVRKLSDAAAGAVVEISAAAFSNAGSFWLFAPGNNGSPVAFDWVTRGSFFTTGVTPSVATYPAPGTFVLTGTGDIAADNRTLRVNGASAGTNTQDQGTGNFLAYPLYIGRRGGTTLPFNGQIYSLIVRFGTNLDAGTITSTETWVNSKTGAYT